MSLRELLRGRLLRVVQAEQARTRRRIVDEVVRLGGVPGVPLGLADGEQPRPRARS